MNFNANDIKLDLISKKKREKSTEDSLRITTKQKESMLETTLFYCINTCKCLTKKEIEIHHAIVQVKVKHEW